MNPKVDWFFEKDTQWKNEYQYLRTIVLDCGLIEELKWGVPCYMYNNANILLIHGFKNYCAILFNKGVLLNDAANILIQQTKHVQSARQIRFTDIKEIEVLESTIKAYIYEAIEVEKAGLKVAFKKTSEVEVPAEMKTIMAEDIEFKNAFKALTPGRQRGYLIFFSGAKQAQTRIARIEKNREKILNGEGLNDQYKSKQKK